MQLLVAVGLAYSNSLFAENNRALLTAAEEIYGGSFSQREFDM